VQAPFGPPAEIADLDSTLDATHNQPRGTAVFGHYSSAGTIPGPVVIAGVLPAPLESSRPRGWNGIVVERYRTNCVNVVEPCTAGAPCARQTRKI